MSTELAPVFEFTTEIAATTEHVIEAWLAGRNDKTRRGYLSDLGQFAVWSKRHHHIRLLMRYCVSVLAPLTG